MELHSKICKEDSKTHMRQSRETNSKQRSTLASKKAKELNS